MLTIFAFFDMIYLVISERRTVMVKYIPYDKLSKKKQRELNKAKRGSWDGINPVTRMPENSKAYNRRKAQNWKRECCSDSVPFHFL